MSFYWLIALSMAAIMLFVWAVMIPYMYNTWAKRASYSDSVDHEDAVWGIVGIAIGILAVSAAWPLGIFVTIGAVIGFTMWKRAKRSSAPDLTKKK